jgi:uncharacterized membrane protein (UPF0127 family)
MAEMKHEVIHLHKDDYRRSRYFLWLLVPSITFVSVVGLLLYFLGIKQQNLATTSEVEVVAMEREMKSVLVGGKIVYVEVANNDLSRQKGLAGKTSIGENEGMLFVFPSQDVRPSFWMKGVEIAIDIIWINEGKITQIDRGVQPEPGVSEAELTFYMPADPIDYVLEVNAGFCKRNLIEVGDEVDLTKAL